MSADALSRYELRRWAKEHKELGVHGNSSSEVIQAAIAASEEADINSPAPAVEPTEGTEDLLGICMVYLFRAEDKTWLFALSMILLPCANAPSFSYLVLCPVLLIDLFILPLVPAGKRSARGRLG
jgi:hypothetical protein